MTTENYYGGYEAILRSLDEAVQRKLVEIRYTPTTWNSILPADSYYSNFSWSATSVPVQAKASIGTFSEMSDIETKDTPNITFSLDHDRIDLYALESSLKTSIEQLDHFAYWMNNGGFGTSSFVDQLMNSARQVYETNHDEIFLYGDKKRTKGLLNHDDITDVTEKFADETGILQLFSKLFMEMRSLTKGISHAGKALISPKLYSLMLKYYESSSLSDLSKLLQMPVDTAPDGTPITPKLHVLDKLNPTEAEEKTKPYGDIYILSRNSDDFMYYFKPLLIHSFREIDLRSFGAYMKFKYSQPYIVTKHSILKCTPNSKVGTGI